MTPETVEDILQQVRTGKLDVLDLMAVADDQLRRGDPRLSVLLYQTWIDGHQDHPLLFAVLFNFGVLLNSQRDHVTAAAAFRAAIQLKPDFLSSYINLGTTLEQTGDRTGAVSLWREALERLSAVTSDAIEIKMLATKHLGRVLESANLDPDAEEALRQGLSVMPQQRDAIQHWINLRQRQCRWPVIDPFTPLTRQQLLENISPLSLAGYVDDPLWQLANAAEFTRSEIGVPERVFAHPRPTDIKTAQGQRLKIGYLSSDLCEHAVGYLTAEVYGLHDRSAVEIFAYYCGTRDSDRIQERIRSDVDHWRDLRGLNDRAAATVIASDQISILIDLNGHTKDARTALLAWRPAPVIVNWLGFPGSMGSVLHHYIIADDFIIPPDHDLYFSEKVMRLPCYQPADRQRLVASHTPSRAEVGLPDQAMVYCCFNEARKITQTTWEMWLDILDQVPDSVLWLLVPASATQAHLRKMAENRGIDPARLIFAPRQLNPDHLARYALTDLILDTFPYGAHTTASDALWMGVPVVTLVGQSFASRVCGSLLRAAGLPELVCTEPQAYVATAVRLGRSAQQRQDLRERLRSQRQECQLFDTPRLVRALEGLYRQMWQDWLEDRLPSPDLSNLPVYRDIAIELDGQKVEPSRERYREALAARQSYTFLTPDRRLWTAPP